jgi:hypothetical protein
VSEIKLAFSIPAERPAPNRIGRRHVPARRNVVTGRTDMRQRLGPST